MKNRLFATTGLIALIASTSAFGVYAQSTTPGTPGAPTAPRGRKERHPELRKAMRELEAANRSLQSAAHDFAGHREAALDLTAKAMAEVKLALQSDKQ